MARIVNRYNKRDDIRIDDERDFAKGRYRHHTRKRNHGVDSTIVGAGISADALTKARDDFLADRLKERKAKEYLGL